MKKTILLLFVILYFPLVAAKDLTGIKIYVNPGHGGYDVTGDSNTDDRNVPVIGHPAGDTTGFWESSSNLRKGLHLRDELLRHNATVKMNRTANTSADDWLVTVIAADVNAFNPDAFLSIHSNATGDVPSAANYPFLIYRGYPDPIADTFPALRESENMCRFAYPYELDNPLTVWSAFYPYDADNIRIGPNNGGAQMYIYVPGFLSEGEFHDYLPEACRLLNTDYDHLEAIRFLNFFLDYFGADRDATGTLAGYVKDKDAKMQQSKLYYYKPGTDDQWVPLNGAKVILRNAAGDSISAYTCDNNYNGVFAFYNLAQGNYQLEACDSSHVTQTVNVTVAGGGEITYKKIFLQSVNTTPDIPRIYASELNSVSTSSGYNLSFTLNTDATYTAITFTPATQSGLPIGIYTGALPQGRNSVYIDNTRLPAGQYTWEVTARAASLSDPVQFTNNDDSQVQFYSACGVSVDNDFDSPFFGRVYVSSSFPGTTVLSGRSTGQGIYILDAAMTDITRQGVTPYSGGMQWATSGSSSPLRCNVAPDGQVYICDWSSAASGVYVMNPANPSTAFRQVFGGSRASNGLFSSGGTAIGGEVSACYVLGKNDSARLYTVDGTYRTGLNAANNVLQYDLGTSANPWVSAPSAVVFNNYAQGNLELNGNSAIAPDARGGWFMSQTRNAGNDAAVCPALIHISSSGKIDFNSGNINPPNGLIGGSYGSGLAVTQDGNRLAICANGDYQIYDIAYGAGNVPALTQAYDIVPAIGQTNYSLAFDRAGNLYAVSTDAQQLAGYSLPVADNTFTTPAPSSQVLDYTNTGINIPKISQLKVYPNPAQDVVHVECGVALETVKLVDLTGRTVMNVPVNQNQTTLDINLSGVPAGNYILLVNNVSVKVEKK